MTKPETKLGKLVCKCIKEHTVLWFYYESSSGKYWRKVDPYILAIKNNGTGNIFLPGMLILQKKRSKKRRTIIKDNIYLTKLT